MLMPKINCGRGILFCLFSLFWLAADAGIQATFYVSPSGNDANPGSLSQPFQTIGRAQTAVRAINGSMTGDIYVYLRGGIYTLTSAIVFTDLDAGTDGYNIFYTAYPNEHPIISGGLQVTGWTPATGRLWQASVSGVTDKIRQIYVNGLRADMAQGPAIVGAGPYGLYQGHAAGIYFNASSLGTYSNQQDMEVNDKIQYVDFYWGVDTIISTAGLKAVLLQQPFFKWAQYILWEPLGFQTDTMRFANAYEFLGTPGQFYYNRYTQTLYYTPRDGEAMTTARVMIPALTTLVQFDGSSLSQKVHNIEITGIEFDYAKYNLEEVDGGTGYFAGQGNFPFITMGKVSGQPDWGNNQFNDVRAPVSGIQLDNASHIVFSGNTFQHMGSMGIDLHNAVSNCVIQGNVFNDIASSAVNVGSPQNGFLGDGLREAESATLAGGASVISDDSASGGQTVHGFNTLGSSITFSNVRNSAGWSFNYAAEDITTLSLYRNDTFQTHVVFYPSGGPNSYTCAASPGYAFINNYNFEFDTAGWTNLGNASIVNDSSKAFTGKYYAKITGEGGFNQLFTSGFTIGENYTYQGNGMMSNGTGEGTIGAKCHDASGNVLAQSYVTFTTDTACYVSKSGTITIPSGTVTLELFAWNTNNNAVFSADELGWYQTSGYPVVQVPAPAAPDTTATYYTLTLKRDSGDTGGDLRIDYLGGGEFTYTNEQICKDNVIDDNYFRNNTFGFRTACTITGYFTDSLAITHNDIDHTSYSGISQGWGWNYPCYTSRNTIISYNSIRNVMENAFDGGAIYTNGSQPNSVMSYNYAYNDRNQYGELYQDNGSQFFKVNHNVVEDVAPGVPWLRLNYYAYQNIADSNYTDAGPSSAAFLFDTASSSITNTIQYDSTARPAAAQAIMDSAGLQGAWKSIIPVFTAPQYTVNNGFESGDTLWTNLGNDTIIDDPGNAHSGSYYVSVGGEGGVDQYMTSGFTIGANYTLEGYGKMSGSGSTGYIGVKCYNSSGLVLQENNFPYTTETTYTYKMVTFNIPAGTVKMEIYAWNSNALATFSADDISLKAEQAANPGFESGNTVWTNLGSSTITNDASHAHSGSYYVNTTGTGGVDQLLSASQFKIGYTYTISGYGYMSNTTGDGVIGVKFLDGNGNILQENDLNFTSQTSYTLQSAAVTVPDGTAQILVFVWDDNSNAVFYADDISFR